MKKTQRLPRWRWYLLLSIPLVAIVLASVHSDQEQLVFWDEEPPSLVEFSKQPGRFILEALEASWGRPGFIVLVLAGLAFQDLKASCFGPEFSNIPITFQILLHGASAVLIMLVVWQWAGEKAKNRLTATALSGIAYATSPMLLHYSHRLLPPVYVLPFVLGGMWMLHRGLSAKKRWLCVLAGLTLGGGFTVYPGVYHLLLFVPVALLQRDLRQTRWQCFAAVVIGVLLLPVCIEIFMQYTKATLPAHELQAMREVAFRSGLASGGQMERSYYFTYVDQLLNLSETIVQGDTSESPVFIFRMALDAREFLLIPALLLVFYGVADRRRTAFPFCLFVACVYLLWLVNGPILQREVLYGRTAVLWLPVVFVAAGCVVSESNFELSPARVLPLVTVLSTAITAALLISHPPVRVAVSNVQSDISQLLDLPIETVHVVPAFNDYGPEAADGLEFLGQEFRPNVSGRVFVAFNLRAVTHPMMPYLKLSQEPLLQYRSPIRDRLIQYDGHSPAERAMIRRFPERFDIKVYSLEQLRSPGIKATVEMQMTED